MKKMSTHRRHDDLTECYAERLPVRLQSGQAESLSRKNVGGRGSRCPRTGRRSDFQVVGSCERPLAFGNLCDAGVQEQWQVTSGERLGMKGEAPSVVRQTDATLFKVALARFTFSRISVALVVQIKGLGFWLW